MNPVVNTATLNIEGREFLLADVQRGMGQIGMFRLAVTKGSATDLFYIENEPILNIVTPNVNDPYTDKVVTQISGSGKCSDYIKSRLTGVGENCFVHKQGLMRAAMPALELLTEGLYVVHESKMLPADGCKHFFWNRYNVSREVKGTADKSVEIGEANFSPVFLMPSLHATSYSHPRMMTQADKARKEKQPGGVAYHVAGMYSVLLEGHHTATACLLTDVDFRCVVIEPLRDVIYDPKDDDETDRNIVALSCPFIKIPVDKLPENMLERFLITRKYTKPTQYPEIKSKVTKTIRSVSKRSFPVDVYEKAAQLPDCAMLASSSAVNALSEEQIMAILSGEVMFDDKYIVSPNYYNSVIAVCNYLQVTDFSWFLSFAIEILSNEGFSATHKHIADRLYEIIHPTIHMYFSSVVANPEADEEGYISEIARRYMAKWDEYQQRLKEAEEIEISIRRKNAMKKEASGLVQLELAAKNLSAGAKN